MYEISHKEMAMSAILDLEQIIQNPKKRPSVLPKYAYIPNINSIGQKMLAVGLSKNLEKCMGFSIRGIFRKFNGGRLGFGVTYENPRKAPLWIQPRYVHTKF